MLLTVIIHEYPIWIKSSKYEYILKIESLNINNSRRYVINSQYQIFKGFNINIGNN